MIESSIDISGQHSTKVMGKYTDSMILLVLYACSVHADMSYYKLPTNIIPYHYDLSFILRNESFNEKVYQGISDIFFKVTESTDMIILHASRLKIKSVQITKNNAVLAHNSFVLNETRRLLTIDMGQELAVGEDYKVTLKYIGQLLSNSSYGLYQSSYKGPNGNSHHFASTYFNHTHARRAFPCFDEPHLKATFNLTLTYPSNMHAIANTASKSSTLSANKLTVETFQKTPKMSTYLLAFTISDFTMKDNEFVRTWAKIGAENERNFALNLAPKLLEKLDEFTGISFESHGLGKLDIVAVPNFKVNAMEHWGIIYVHELFLLDDENDSNTFHLLAIAQILALEFTRAWFGNLVTVKYWDSIWLDKGLATYFHFMVLNSIYPDWSMDKRLVITTQQQFFHVDGLLMIPPVETNIRSANEICLHLKGASIVNMMAHILGDKFHSGIKKYLKDNSFKNVVSQDLFDAFEAQSPSHLPKNKTFHEVMHNWITKPGYPVIKVSQFENHILISQKRFLYQSSNRSDDQISWYIPITFTKQSDENKFNNTLPEYWLTPEENLAIPLTLNDEWIVFNNLETAYFRVDYDECLWNKIIDALKQDLDQIADLNRAQLVDDIFNFGTIHLVDYEMVFNLADYLVKETNYFVWVTALENFKFLIDRMRSSNLGQAISKKLLGLMQNLLKSVPLSVINDGDQIYTFNQVQAHQTACELGDKNCIQYAKKHFEVFRTTRKDKPVSNFRFFIYCTALRHSTNSTRDWDFLFEQYLSTTNPVEIEIFLLVLGCTKNETILRAYLQKAVSPKGKIPKKDVGTVFQSVVSGNSVGVQVAFDFVTENYREIKYYLKEAMDPAVLMDKICFYFSSAEEVNQLQEFIKNEELLDGPQLALNGALQKAQGLVNWAMTFKSELNHIFQININ